MGGGYSETGAWLYELNCKKLQKREDQMKKMSFLVSYLGLMHPYPLIFNNL